MNFMLTALLLLCLAFQPVQEIETLRAGKHRWQHLALPPGENPLAAVPAELLEVRAEFAPGTAKEVDDLKSAWQ